MTVSPEEIADLARLARLRLGPSEERVLTEQLSGILRHVDALAEIPDEEGDGLSGAARDRTPLRDDASVPDTMVRSPDAAAPAWDSSFYLVPRLMPLDGNRGPRTTKDEPPARPRRHRGNGAGAARW